MKAYHGKMTGKKSAQNVTPYLNNPLPDFRASHHKSCKRWRFRWKAKQSFLLLSRQRQKWWWSRWRRWRRRRGEEDPGWFDWNESKQSWLSKKIYALLSVTDCDPLSLIFWSILTTFEANNFLRVRAVSLTKMWLVPKTNKTCQGKIISTGPICNIANNQLEAIQIIRQALSEWPLRDTLTLRPNLSYGRQLRFCAFLQHTQNQLGIKSLSKFDPLCCS